jgi:aspartate carbamoyltransferase catalytic subunit
MLSLTPTTDKAAAAWEQLGVQAYDANGELRDLPTVFAELNTAMQDMTDQEKTETLSAMFNKTDLAAIQALIGTTTDRYNELSAAIEDSDGAAKAMADTQLDNLAGDITLFQSALEGAKIAVCGDVMHSRVARSNIYGLTTMGANVVLCAPPTLIPPRIEELGCTVAPTIEDACEGADVVMGLRIQRERQQKGLFPSVAEYCDNWEITPERVALAKKHALVMHPGPMNRGVEIASSAADSPQSVINQQVESGVSVRMALLYMLTRREA